jgi:hypothetical protein
MLERRWQQVQFGEDIGRGVAGYWFGGAPPRDRQRAAARRAVEPQTGYLLPLEIPVPVR